MSQSTTCWSALTERAAAAASVALLLAAGAAVAAPVRVGDSTPDLSLSSIDGKEHTLSEAVTDGPVVLVLYRGVW